MKETSSGGVVVRNGKVLILKKFRGDWVLPKGRLEEGENIRQAALREVLEETGVSGTIKEYIGYLKYNYKHSNGEIVNKTVHYFLMYDLDNTIPVPQREEGFFLCYYMDFRSAIKKLRYGAEKKHGKKAYQLIQRNNKKWLIQKMLKMKFQS